MEELERSDKNICEYALCRAVFFGILCGETSLCELYIPVTVYIPCEIVDRRERNADLEFFKRGVDRVRKLAEAGEYPLVLGGKLFGGGQGAVVYREVHADKARGVP